MNITMLEPSRLKNYEKNARTHSDEQIEQIIKSIKDYGFNVPVEVNPDFVILSGHARVMAATKMGLEKIPVVIHEHLTQESKQKGYILAANKIAMNAGWDDGILTDELRTLMDDPEFDMESTGFDLDELAAMFPPPEPIRFSDEDDVPETPAEPKTKPGDIWVLGNHRLMCGDSTSIDAVERLMDGIKADMIFTDPPYGMNYSGRGKNTSHKILNDDIDPTEFYNLMPEIEERYIWGRVENYAHLLTKPRDVIVWKKNGFGMGSGYRGQYEVCFYYGNFKGSDSDVWEIPKDISYIHPTQKPTALAERAIKNSNPKTVIDLFGGSGSTLIACEKLNRKCFMMELDPIYCDVIVQRWENFTGKRAVLDLSCTRE